MSSTLTQQVSNYLSPYLGGSPLIHTPDITSVTSLELSAGATYFTIEQMSKNADGHSYQVEVSLFVPSADFFDQQGDLHTYSYLIQNRSAHIKRIKVGSKVYMHQQLSARIHQATPVIIHQQTTIKINGRSYHIKAKESSHATI